MKRRDATSQRCSHCLQPLGVAGLIVELLREQGPLSVKQLAKKTGAKPRAVRACLAALPLDRVHHIDLWELRDREEGRRDLAGGGGPNPPSGVPASRLSLDVAAGQWGQEAHSHQPQRTPTPGA